MASFFTGLTAVGAFVRIPLPFVPITLQVLMVILSGLLLSPRAALLSQAAYILLGLSGVPVFSGGGGISYILSPTFGYLLGQLPAAWIIAALVKRSDISFRRLFPAAVGGVSIIYFLGAAVLFLNFNYLAEKPSTVGQILHIGVYPFILPDLLKAVAASLIALKIRMAVRHPL
ncbi:biotin transporter BioY [Aminivibrio sp.]|uniref:biotin transporter BioY n=1 Tax=Aminivibrio sp. TaxID=1872489 RepID=UPI0025C3A3BF|nr:biotin transporter BioY [Aminivibrio sp.]